MIAVKTAPKQLITYAALSEKGKAGKENLYPKK